MSVAFLSPEDVCGFSPSLTIVQQRSFRHIRAIHVRNIQAERLVDSCLSFHPLDSSEVEELPYKTPISLQTLNPSFEFDWEELDLLTLRERLDIRTFELVLHVLPETTVFRSIIHFGHLQFFTDSLTSFTADLPFNCVIFEFVDGYFLPEDYITAHSIPCSSPPSTDAISPSHSEPASDPSSTPSTPLTSSLPTLLRVSGERLVQDVSKLTTLRAQVSELNERIPAVRSRLSTRLELSMRVQAEVKQEYELRKKTCDRLRGLIDAKESELVRLRSVVNDERRSLVTSGQDFLQSQQRLLENHSLLSEKRRLVLPQYRSTLDLLRKKRNLRRRLILRDMQQIYVIRVEDGTINGLSIYDSKGELEFNEDSAAGLGYVAHAVLMISKILQIPLPHRILSRSSRSGILFDSSITGGGTRTLNSGSSSGSSSNSSNSERSHHHHGSNGMNGSSSSSSSSGDSFTLLPLFLERSRERERCVKAVHLLGLNIRHLIREIGGIVPWASSSSSSRGGSGGSSEENHHRSRRIAETLPSRVRETNVLRNLHILIRQCLAGN